MLTIISIVRLLCFSCLLYSLYLVFSFHFFTAFLLYFFAGAIYVLLDVFRPSNERLKYRDNLYLVLLLLGSLSWPIIGFWVYLRKFERLQSGKRYDVCVWENESSRNHFYFSKWKDALNFAQQAIAKEVIINDTLSHAFVHGVLEYPIWFLKDGNLDRPGFADPLDALLAESGERPRPSKLYYAILLFLSTTKIHMFKNESSIEAKN